MAESRRTLPASSPKIADQILAAINAPCLSTARVVLSFALTVSTCSVVLLRLAQKSKTGPEHRVLERANSPAGVFTFSDPERTNKLELSRT